MSTEILTSSKSRHHHSSKAGAGRRSASKASRSKRRTHSSKEKPRDREKEKVKNKAPIREDDCPEEVDMIPSRLRVEIPVAEPDHMEEGVAVEGKSLYKKRIDNPFQTENAAIASISREPRRRETKEGKTSETERKERLSYRSKSWHPHRSRVNVADGEHAGKSPISEDRYGCVRERDFTADHLLQPDVKPIRELPLDYGSGYPQSSTLRIDDKVRHQREGNSRETPERENKDGALREAEYKSVMDHCNPTVRTSEDTISDTKPYPDTDAVLPVHPYDPAINRSYEPALAWLKPSLQRKHSLRLSHRDDVQLSEEISSQQQACTDTQIRTSTSISKREQRSTGQGDRPGLTADSTLITDPEGFREDDYRLYQRTDEQEDEDACSSLCLNEEELIDDGKAYQRGISQYHDPHLVYSHPDPDLLYQGPHNTYYDLNSKLPQVIPVQVGRESTLNDCIPSATLKESSLSSTRPGETNWNLLHHHQRTRSLGDQSEPSLRPGTLIQGERRLEAGLSVDCADPPEVVDSSIFDYCQASEVESDTETVLKSTDEADGESAHWACEVEEVREEGYETLGERGFPPTHRAGLSVPSGTRVAEIGEIGENQSITGDSGIDSPR
ncbi:hypothetical protein LDENG_00220550 [Lucifuga dentata]|nr:hypothetical protein LDENG_00220550 [Lucifuga dentata]